MCVCVCVRERERERGGGRLTALGTGETLEVVDLVQSQASCFHTDHRFITASAIAYIMKHNYMT